MRSASAEGGTTRSCATAACGSSSVMATSAETGVRRTGMMDGPQSMHPRYRLPAPATEGRDAPHPLSRTTCRDRTAPTLFLRRQRPHIGDDGIEIGIRHVSVVLVAHRALERRAVLPLALGDRSLDLGVGPVADARGLV